MAGRTTSRRSLLALDALNVVLADVRDGLGPYLAIYLGMRHWAPSRIGLAMAVVGVATVAAQTPAGALVDSVRRKRGLVAIAAGLVAIGSVAMVRSPTLPVILGAQATIGVAAAVFGPAIAAISLGLVGRGRLPWRLGRNEAYNHAGNVAAALVAGLIGEAIAYEGIFYLVAAMSALSIASVLAIRESDIDHDLARGSDTDAKPGEPHPLHDAIDPPSAMPRVVGLRQLLDDRRILTFAAAVVLFHFANAAMLPLVGQKVEAGHTHGAALSMSACIVAAQLVMVPVALLASRWAEARGRKPVFLVGFAVLPIRGLLYTLSTNPYYLVAVQLLDGIGAGIFGVVSVLVIADLTRGTGRFNLVQGALATAVGLGASASNLLTGYIVQGFGFDAGFVALAAIAALAFAFYFVAVPETKRSEEEPRSSEPSEAALAGAAP
jgi:MFS family permease